MAQVKITLDTFTTYTPDTGIKPYPKLSIDKYGKQAVSVFIIVAETENKQYTLSISDNAKLSSKKIISYKAVEDDGTSRFDEIDPEIGKKYAGKYIAVFNIFDYDLYTVVSTASKEDKYVTIVVSGDEYITDNIEIPITVEPFKTRELDYTKIVKLEYNYKPFNNFETTIPLFNDPVIGTKIKSEKDETLESILYATLSEELLSIYYGVYSDWIASFYIKNKTTGEILVQNQPVFKYGESPKILLLENNSKDPFTIETYIKYFDADKEVIIDTFTVYPATTAPIDLKHTTVISNNDYAVKLEWTNITLYNVIYNIYRDNIKIAHFEGEDIKEYVDELVFDNDGIHEYRIGIYNPLDINALESMSLTYEFEIPKATEVSNLNYSIKISSGYLTITHKLVTNYKYKYTAEFTGFKYAMDSERVDPLPYSTQNLIKSNLKEEFIKINISGVTSLNNLVTYTSTDDKIRITYGPCIVFSVFNFYGSPYVFNRLDDIYMGTGVPVTINIDSLDSKVYTYSWDHNIFDINNQMLLFTGKPYDVKSNLKIVSRSIKSSDGSSVGNFTGQGFFDSKYTVSFSMKPYTKISELLYLLDFDRTKFPGCCFYQAREFHPVKYNYTGILPLNNVIKDVRKPHEVHLSWDNNNTDPISISISAYDYASKYIVKTVNGITSTFCDINFITTFPAPVPHLDLYFIATITSGIKSYIQDLGRYTVNVATTAPSITAAIVENYVSTSRKSYQVTVTEQNVSSGTYRFITVETFKVISSWPIKFELQATETLSEHNNWEDVDVQYLYSSSPDTYSFSYGHFPAGGYISKVTMVNALNQSFSTQGIIIAKSS